MTMRFRLGQTVITPGALAKLSSSDVLGALQRHQAGDWGNLCPDDAVANEQALQSGARLLSVYASESGTKFWSITEADRSATTILLPEAY